MQSMILVNMSKTFLLDIYFFQYFLLVHFQKSLKASNIAIFALILKNYSNRFDLKYELNKHSNMVMCYHDISA